MKGRPDGRRRRSNRRSRIPAVFTECHPPTMIPSWRFRQAMGGGKTHSMLALGYLAANPDLTRLVPKEIAEGFKPAAAKVVAISGRSSQRRRQCNQAQDRRQEDRRVGTGSHITTREALSRPSIDCLGATTQHLPEPPLPSLAGSVPMSNSRLRSAAAISLGGKSRPTSLTIIFWLNRLMRPDGRPSGFQIDPLRTAACRRHLLLCCYHEQGISVGGVWRPAPVNQ